MAVEHI